MGRQQKAPTVAEWYSHFIENPWQTLPEYQIDWSTIRNNIEGTNSKVAVNTIASYLSKFRQRQLPTSEPQNGSNPVTITITIKIG